MSSLRFPIAFLCSAVITVALFGVLRALINVRADAEAAAAFPKVEFVRLRRSVEIEEKKREKPERAKPEQTPRHADARRREGGGRRPRRSTCEAIAAGLGAEFGSAGRWRRRRRGWRASPSAPASPTAIPCRSCASSRSTRRRRAQRKARRLGPGALHDLDRGLGQGRGRGQVEPLDVRTQRRPGGEQVEVPAAAARREARGGPGSAGRSCGSRWRDEA